MQFAQIQVKREKPESYSQRATAEELQLKWKAKNLLEYTVWFIWIKYLCA